MPEGTVLVVEDDALVRIEISEHLRACGYEVVEAEDGERALEVLNSGAAIDLVFSDVEMPGEIDGLALARWALEHRTRLPVLLTSGDEPAMKVAEQLCHEGLPIRKPYSAGSVVTRVGRILADQTTTAAGRPAGPEGPGPPPSA